MSRLRDARGDETKGRKRLVSLRPATRLESRELLIPGLARFQVGNRGQRRPFAQPCAQFVQSFPGSAREHFDVAVVQVIGITGDTEPLCFPARAVPEPDTLNPATNPNQAGLTAGIAIPKGYVSSSMADVSVALRASNAFILACFASRLACEYCRSLSLFSALCR